MPEHFSWTSSDYNVDDWVWDQSNKSPEVELSSDKECVYFYTDPVHQSTVTVFQLGIENGGVRIWKKGTSARQKL
jgi:hypothetical protein